MARKPRDFDAELQALMDKARKVRGKKAEPGDAASGPASSNGTA